MKIATHGPTRARSPQNLTRPKKAGERPRRKKQRTTLQIPQMIVRATLYYGSSLFPDNAPESEEEEEEVVVINNSSEEEHEETNNNNAKKKRYSLW